MLNVILNEGEEFFFWNFVLEKIELVKFGYIIVESELFFSKIEDE